MLNINDATRFAAEWLRFVRQTFAGKVAVSENTRVLPEGLRHRVQNDGLAGEKYARIQPEQARFVYRPTVAKESGV
jgi:hypothetical protein